MTSYTYVGGSTNVPPATVPYAAVTLSASLTFSWSTEFGVNPNVIADLMDITATQNGLSITLPAADNTSVGTGFRINNPSAFPFQVLAADGTFIATLNAASAKDFWLYDNTTAPTNRGLWRTGTFIGAGGVSFINADASGTMGNLVIGGVPITTAGTITFTFADDLGALIGFGNGIGFSARTAPNTWELRALTGSTDFVINNPEGVAANPLFELAPALGVGGTIDSILVGNLQLESDGVDPLLSAVNTGINIIFNPATGGGLFVGNKPTVPLVEPLSNNQPLVFAKTLTDGGYSSFESSNTNPTYVNQMVLPSNLPVEGQVLGVNSITPLTQPNTQISILEWLSVVNLSGTSVPFTLSMFVNATGGLASTGISVAGVSFTELTGLTKLTLDTLTIEPTVITSNADLTLQFASNQSLRVFTSGISGALDLITGGKLRFRNAADTAYTDISQNSALLTNVELQLPPIPPIIGQTLGVVGGSGGAFQMGWVTTPTVTLPTTPNGIAVFANSAGLLNSSTMTLVGNVIIGIPSTPMEIIPGSGSTTFTLGLTSAQMILNASQVNLSSGTSLIFQSGVNQTIITPRALPSTVTWLLPQTLSPSGVLTINTSSGGGTTLDLAWINAPHFDSVSTATLFMDATPNTISAEDPMTAGDGSIHLVPAGSENVHLHNGVIVRDNSQLRLNNNTNTNHFSFQAHPLTAIDTRLVLPQFAPGVGAFLRVSSITPPSYETEWVTSPMFDSISTANLQIDGTGNENTIKALNLNGDVNLKPDGSGDVTLGNLTGTGITNIIRGMELLAGAYIDFTSPTDNKTTRVQQIDGAPADVTLNLPITAPLTNGLLMVTGVTSPYTLDYTLTPAVTNLTTTNLSIEGIAANTITATNVNGSVILTSTGLGVVSADGPLHVKNNNPLQLKGNNFTVDLFASPSATQSYTVLMPPNRPTEEGQTLRSTTSGASAVLAWSDTFASNILINPSMLFWQRNSLINSATTFFPNNNNQYTADGWKLQSNGNNIVSVSRTAGFSGNAFSSAASMTMTVQTAGAKFGQVQILSFQQTQAIFGKTCSLSLAALSTGITTLRMAVIYWTGAVDAPTTPIVSSWNGAGSNPTLVAGWTYANIPTNLTLTGTATRYTASNILLTNPSTNNAAVFFWCDDVPAFLGYSLSVSSVALQPTAAPTPFVAPNPADDFLRCKYFFQKDFPPDVAVGSASTWSAAAVIPVFAASVGNTNTYYRVNFDTPMRIAPTVVTYPYTTVTNTGRASSGNGTDGGANTASLTPGVGTIGPTPAVDAHGFAVTNNSGAGLSATNQMVFMHWYADASF